MDVKRICYNCMKEKPEAHEACPYCRFVNEDYKYPSSHLSPMTPLNGRYLVGRALGAGGFGITYIALDLHLQVVVAIKELYLKKISMRNQTKSISVQPKDKVCFEENMKRFLEEARILARFNEKDNEGIVIVKEHFQENDTAYIVMEYLDGSTLKKKVEGKKMSFQETKDLLAPVCHAIMKVHQFGVIHMDVSPDNIMVLKNGKAKLLDFGGAKNMDAVNSGDFIAFKRGYAPPEQYMENGKIGEWTDVYATAATIYFCLTGVKPVDSMERRAGTELERPSKLGVKIPAKAEQALMRALELTPVKRFQSMEEFWDALNTKGKRSRLAIGIAAAVLVLGVGVTYVLTSDFGKEGTKDGGVVAAKDNEAAASAQVNNTAVEGSTAETDPAEAPQGEAEVQQDDVEAPQGEAEVPGEEVLGEAEPVQEPEYEIGETIPVDLGTYIFENVADSNFIMGIDSGFVDEGATLKVKAYEDKNCNRFSVTDEITDDGFYNLRAAHTNSFVESAGTQDLGAVVAQYLEMNDSGTEKWNFVYCGKEDDKNIVILKNAAGSVLAPENGSVADGTNIVLAEENMEDNSQKWYMRWSERDESEGPAIVFKEGDLVENISGVHTMSSALDGETMFSVSRYEGYAEPTIIVWTNVWDATQQFEFVPQAESRYKIFPVDQLEGERKCLEYNDTDHKIVMRDESDSTNQLFRVVYAGYNMYLLQCYNETVVGFDVNEDGSKDGNAVLGRLYEEVDDSRRVKWLIKGVE